MEEKIYDVIVIGGGPSGLLCAITAVIGIPINEPRGFSGLVLDKDEIGEFAKYGRLRITHQWHFDGWQVIEFLKQEAAHSGIELKNHEEVIDVSLDNEYKIVRTTKQHYLARKLAICTGFYPYGNIIRYSQFMRPIFGPIEWETQTLPQEKGYKIIVIGGSHSTCETAMKLKELRPDLHVTVIIDEKSDAPEQKEIPGVDILYGRIEVKSAKRKKIKIEVHTKQQEKKTLNCQYALMNYNSYIHRTGTTDFLAHLGVKRINGYIPVDRDGNTGIPGVIAAGNIVTPVSGVLTAFSTGYTAGLNLYTQLYRERFHELPVLYPWLPLDNPLEHVLVQADGKQPGK